MSVWVYRKDDAGKVIGSLVAPSRLHQHLEAGYVVDPSEFEEVAPETSQAFTLPKSKPIIAAFGTVAEVESFCEGDERVGIQSFAAECIDKLNG